ncbi:hypothetical protein [Butyrivibrio fibrisolvens]|uniref:hypothetical protein n=1 Tax=Butyrivibrio fibrisolvens TaxID=831 RepID=UPI0003B6FBF4|nr:hypothetical protein [Butyrivibrio fibrisolvens]
MVKNYETPNCGIIRGEKRIKQVSVRMGPTLLARIKKESSRKNMSVAGFIQSLLTDYFEHEDLEDNCKQRKTDKPKKKLAIR